MSNERPEDISPQFAWHRKPAGHAGSPCPVCGCPAKRLKALHRALTAEEGWRRGALWVKCVKVCFGLDSSIENIDVDQNGDRNTNANVR